MHPYDIFRCQKLHENVTYSRCVLNQKEAIRFFGEDASKFNSCPCEKGLEIKRQMGGETIMKGTCDNCKREDLAVYSRGGFGLLCASCSGAVTGLSKDDALKALAEKKEHFAGKGKMRGPEASKIEAKEQVPAIETVKEKPAKETVKLPAASILVCFNNGDEKLFSDFCAAAKRNRREPDQHILFLIEHAINIGPQIVSTK